MLIIPDILKIVIFLTIFNKTQFVAPTEVNQIFSHNHLDPTLSLSKIKYPLKTLYSSYILSIFQPRIVSTSAYLF